MMANMAIIAIIAKIGIVTIIAIIAVIAIITNYNSYNSYNSYNGLRSEPTPTSSPAKSGREGHCVKFGRGDDTVGHPHRAQIFRFELFELVLLLKLGTVPCRAIRGNSIVSQSTVPSPPLKNAQTNGLMQQMEAFNRHLA